MEVNNLGRSIALHSLKRWLEEAMLSEQQSTSVLEVCCPSNVALGYLEFSDISLLYCLSNPPICDRGIRCTNIDVVTGTGKVCP